MNTEILLAVALVLFLVSESGYFGEGKRFLFPSLILILAWAGALVLWRLTQPGSIDFYNFFINDAFTAYLQLLLLGSGIFTAVLIFTSLQIRSTDQMEHLFTLILTLLLGFIAIKGNHVLLAALALQVLLVSSLFWGASNRLKPMQQKSAFIAYSRFMMGSLMVWLGVIFYLLGHASPLFSLAMKSARPGFLEINLWITPALFFIAFAFIISENDLSERGLMSIVFLNKLTLFIAFLCILFRVTTFGSLLGIDGSGVFSFESSRHFHDLILTIALILAAIGTVFSFRPQHIQRTVISFLTLDFAFSLLGLLTREEVGMSAALFSLFNTALSGSAVFLLLSFLLDTLQGEKDLRGTAYRYPIIAISFTVAIFSWVGLPPFFGFSSRFSLVSSLLRTEELSGVILAFAIFVVMWVNTIQVTTLIFRAGASPAKLSRERNALALLVVGPCVVAPFFLKLIFDFAASSVNFIFR